MELSAVVLAGGESKRMGRDKALIQLEGQTLLALAVEKVRRLGVAQIFISGRPGRDYSAVADPVLFDLEPGVVPELESRLEPLAAIYPKRCHQFARDFVARSRPVVCQFAKACLEERAVRKFELTNADAAFKRKLSANVRSRPCGAHELDAVALRV